MADEFPCPVEDCDVVASAKGSLTRHINARHPKSDAASDRAASKPTGDVHRQEVYDEGPLQATCSAHDWSEGHREYHVRTCINCYTVDYVRKATECTNCSVLKSRESADRLPKATLHDPHVVPRYRALQASVKKLLVLVESHGNKVPFEVVNQVQTTAAVAAMEVEDG